MPPLGRSLLYTEGMCPYVEVLTQTCLRAFLGSPTRTEILHCGISLARRLDSVTGISPLRGPPSQLLDGMCPRSKANTNPTLLKGFSPLEGSIHNWDFLHSETSLTGTTVWDKQPLGNYASNQVPNISESKQISPGKHPIPNKTIARQNMQDLNTFISNIYCFYCKNFRLYSFKYILGYI